MLFSKEIPISGNTLLSNVCTAFPFPFLLTFLFLLRASIALTQTISPMTGHFCKSSHALGIYLFRWQERGCGCGHGAEWTFLWRSLPHCGFQGTVAPADVKLLFWFSSLPASTRKSAGCSSGPLAAYGVSFLGVGKVNDCLSPALFYLNKRSTDIEVKNVPKEV